ncbi:hypothetical protein VM1G_12027 [Cytospora mali]|uniref:Uncharacterized protein n=1 Tax=Cytospora mali TaxID=578113 RepID=A0A194VIM6_CYTMA|nr:hypothetical protein VM1G_12027 [Valsa mali]
MSWMEGWEEAYGKIVGGPEQPRCWSEFEPCYEVHWVTVEVRFMRTGDTWRMPYGTFKRPTDFAKYMLLSTRLTKLNSDTWPHGLQG